MRARRASRQPPGEIASRPDLPLLCVLQSYNRSIYREFHPFLRPPMFPFLSRLFALRTRGFTLLELLIVLIVAAIIIALVTIRFMDARKEAYRDAMLSDLRNYAIEQELWRSKNHAYA